MDKKFTEFKLTQRYGMEGKGDWEDEWRTPEEIEQSNKAFKEYVENCKRKGIYGKEYTINIQMEHADMFDNFNSNKASESYRMVILNIDDIKKL
jgi:hypothetical protein